MASTESRKIDWVEAIGLLALILSLVFVGLEVRQNTIATRAAAYQAHGEHLSNQWQEAALNEDVVRLTLADESNWDQLTAVERTQLTFLWVSTFRNYETILLQVEEGLLDEDAMNRLGWGDAFEPGYSARMLWPEISKQINPRVREHIEARYPDLVAGAPSPD